MPNRIIKESITASETLATLDDAEERHFWRLLVQADDYGYFDGRPKVIRAKAYVVMLDNVTEEASEQRTQALVSAGLIHLFKQEGKQYGHFPRWDRHQQKRAKYSKFPNVLSCDSECNQVLAYVPEKRDIIHEKRETRSETEASAKPKPKPAWEGPEWFQPLTLLPGYKKGSHETAVRNIAGACGDANVDVDAVVEQFAKDYRELRHQYGWVDPVASCKGKPLAIAISKVLNGREAHDDRRDISEPRDDSEKYRREARRLGQQVPPPGE